MGAQGTLATCIALLFHHHVATCNAHLLCVPPPGPRGGSRCCEAATASIHGSRRSANSTGCSPSSTWCRRCAGCCRCCCGRCTCTPRVRPKHLPTQGQPAVREGSLRGLLQQDADAIVWAHECATRYVVSAASPSGSSGLILVHDAARPKPKKRAAPKYAVFTPTAAPAPAPAPGPNPAEQ